MACSWPRLGLTGVAAIISVWRHAIKAEETALGNHHIETWTKWLTFCRWHLHICIILNDDVCILIKISLEFVPMCSIGSIGSGNGLVPSGNKPLPITWANVEPDLWCHIISSLGHNELSMSCSPRIHFTNDFFIVIQFKNSNSVVSPILLSFKFLLTQWGRVAHICISKLTIIGSDNGLSPGRRQAIIWTNAGILLIRHSGTNVSEILSKIHIFSFKKMSWKLSSTNMTKWWQFCLVLNVLSYCTKFCTMMSQQPCCHGAMNQVQKFIVSGCQGIELKTFITHFQSNLNFSGKNISEMGPHPTNSISVEFEIQLKVAVLWFNCAQLITTKFCIHLSSVQNSVVISWICYEQEHVLGIFIDFEFDRNIVSGKGAWYPNS